MIDVVDTHEIAVRSLFPAHLASLVSRAATALAGEGFEALVIHSGRSRVAFLDDQAYPFKVNPQFNWWVPLTQAEDSLLHIEPGRRPLLLFTRAEDYWHKPATIPSAAWTAEFDLQVVPNLAAAVAALPTDRGRTALLAEPQETLAALLSIVPAGGLNPPGLLRRLHHARGRKTEYEIQCLREANRLGVRGHRAAAQAFHGGASEFQIQLAFLQGCAQRELELPYRSIIAINENAAALHYQMLETGAPAQSRSLLIDAGANYAGYGSDITRTHAREGGDFGMLIGRMDEMQQSLVGAVRAGVDWRDLHLTAHRQVAELLRDADIIRIEADEAVDNGLSAVFLPHGLGHLLGLQVHDVGGFTALPAGEEIATPEGHASLRLTRVLEEGFVVTMEPGVYFIDSLLRQARDGALANAINWQRVEQLRPFGGIRIEDDLLVTTAGQENLTRDAFNR
ncbi:MAG: Xaa-Pro dipeptidase [Steroidobacteraceae bacterium]